MSFKQIKSFNGGTILKVYKENNTFFYYDAITRQVLPNSSNLLTNLRLDVLDINCAEICVTDIDCPDGGLISNAGFCLISNAGNYLMAN